MGLFDGKEKGKDEMNNVFEDENSIPAMVKKIEALMDRVAEVEKEQKDSISSEDVDVIADDLEKREEAVKDKEHELELRQKELDYKIEMAEMEKNYTHDLHEKIENWYSRLLDTVVKINQE